MGKFGEGLDPVPAERLRLEDRRCGAGLARHLGRASEDSSAVNGSRPGREQPHVVIGVVLAEPMEHFHSGDTRHLEGPEEEGLAVGRPRPRR